MKCFTQRLDEAAENALRQVLGKSNVGFYFPEAWLDVGAEGVSVWSVSIPVGKRSFVVIGNGWSDTEEDFINIFHLSVSLAETPKDIPVTVDDASPCGWAFEHVSTINTWDRTLIRCIDIYERSVAGQHESVVCDEALLFTYEKGQVLISVGGTNFDQLTVNHKSDVIASILKPLILRRTLTDSMGL